MLSALFFTMLAGIPAAVLIVTPRIGRGILDPVIEFIRPPPPRAYLPLIVIWYGIGEVS
ncbi:hypothetical protein [Pseudogemmobacter sonorensis]|uniref:hypothetical protein n=1 Tax=Pseudogemmobacter sonorensis TaxID=2989681 RepID=UPI0036BE68BE